MRVKKQDFPASLLIGAPFGSVWEVGRARGAPPLTRIDDGILIPGVEIAGTEDAAQNDNRGYADAGNAQSLTAADIAEMKKSGADGTAIVSALAKSSATFAEKNALTQVRAPSALLSAGVIVYTAPRSLRPPQEKWLRKKTLKHVTRFRVVQPTPVAIAEQLLERDAERIAGLRWDSLAQLLCLGGVREGARVLVLDGVGGLLVGATAHRMGCRGVILAPHTDASRLPSVGLASKFNLGRVGREGAAGASAPPPLESSAAPALAAAAARFPGAHSGNGHGGAFLVVGVPYSAVLAAVEGGGAAAAAAGASGAAALPVEVSTGEASVADVAADVAAVNAVSVPGDEVVAAETADASGGAGGAADVAADAGDAGAGVAVAVDVDADGDVTGGEAASSGGAAATAPETAVFAGKKRRREAAAASAAQGLSAGLDAVAARAARLAHALPVTTMPLAARTELFLAPGDAADACVVASAWDPAPLLLRVALPLLRPGAPFAVFSPDLPALGALQATLKARGLAVHVALAESWMREHQVLPGRTHPHMGMHGASGFILAGHKVTVT